MRHPVVGDDCGSVQFAEQRANGSLANTQRVTQSDKALLCDFSQNRAVLVVYYELVDRLLATPVNHRNDGRFVNLRSRVKKVLGFGVNACKKYLSARVSRFARNN